MAGKCKENGLISHSPSGGEQLTQSIFSILLHETAVDTITPSERRQGYQALSFRDLPCFYGCLCSYCIHRDQFPETGGCKLVLAAAYGIICRASYYDLYNFFYRKQEVLNKNEGITISGRPVDRVCTILVAKPNGQAK